MRISAGRIVVCGSSFFHPRADTTHIRSGYCLGTFLPSPVSHLFLLGPPCVSIYLSRCCIKATRHIQNSLNEKSVRRKHNRCEADLYHDTRHAFDWIFAVLLSESHLFCSVKLYCLSPIESNTPRGLILILYIYDRHLLDKVIITLI